MLQDHAPSPVPPHVPAPSTPADATLLACVGPVAGAHALVIGHNALDAMCELIRGGCAAATEMQIGDRIGPDPDSAEIVLVPHVTSTAQAGDAIARARRALMMGGRIAVRDATGLLRQQLAALLCAHGFCAVTARQTPDGTVLTAERPIFGPLPRA
jgi:hypothetical protein